jgi:phosphoribosylformylglycinamidine synthase
MKSVLDVIDNGLLKSAHDCSKGGLAVAVSELCMKNMIGCKISLETIPGEKLGIDRILFSESHSRYLLVFDKKNLKKLEDLLKKSKVSFKLIGQFGGDKIQFVNKTKPIVDLGVDKAQKTWLNSLKDLILHG